MDWNNYESDINRNKTLKLIRQFQASNMSIYTMYQKKEQWKYVQGDAKAIMSGVDNITVVYPNYQEAQ